MEFNPYLDKIHLYEADLASTLKELKKEKFDLVIDLHSSIRSRMVAWVLNKPTVHFSKENFRKWLYVHIGWDYLPHNHVVDRYMNTTRMLGVRNDGKGLDFFPCDCESLDPERIPLPFRNSPFVVFSIGGTHFTKRMPAEKWNEILNHIQVPVAIVGGKEDRMEGERIALHPDAGGKDVWNTCGEFTIGESAHLIKKSGLVITHDTGMMHIAAAFQKPTIAIWGNTSPRFGMYPYLTRHLNMEVNDLSCRPCSRIGFPHCPKGHFQCMNQQNTLNPELLTFIRQAIS